MIRAFASRSNEAGIVCSQEGDHKQAEEKFRLAVEMLPEEPVYRHNLGKSLLHQMKPEEAEESFREAIQLNPKFASAHLDLSIALALQCKWQEFFKEYEWRQEYFADLKYQRDLFSFGCKVLTCQQGPYSQFHVL